MNREIKEKMKAANVHQWQVAKEIGISEYTFCRWLRDEPLQEDRKQLILEAVEKLSDSGKGA